MRLNMMYDGVDLFCEAQWQSAYSAAHSKRITEDMPAPIRAAALTVMEWANAEELTLRAAIEKHETVANLRREINRLEAMERAALGR